MSRGKRTEIIMKLDESFRRLQISNLFQIPITYSCIGTAIHLFHYHGFYGKSLSVAGLRRGPAAA